MCKAIFYGLSDIATRQRLQEMVLGRQECGNLFHILILEYELQLVYTVNIPGSILGRACHPVYLNGHGASAVGFYLHIELLGLDGSHQVGIELQGRLTACYDKVARRVYGHSLGYFISGHLSETEMVGIAEIALAVATAQAQKHSRGAGIETLALK